jgi:uncharacterized protein YabN with tetrapyrrole methylase and pyrophosphatase domain
MNKEQKGSLTIVGTGINATRDITDSARKHITQADVVFIAQACPFATHLIESLNNNIVDLAELYEEGKSRVVTYRQMVEHVAQAVYDGKRVCGAFYGHPGVFVYASHRLIRLLHEKGYEAAMEPGISAEDCLVADLGIDPGNSGMQALEVSQFLFYQHIINPHCLLIIWQVGLAGDFNFDSINAEKFHGGLQVLKEELLAFYPPAHEVILYQAATFVLEKPKIERMPLVELNKYNPGVFSTLVIPSIGMPKYDEKVLARFGISATQLEENLDGLWDD